MVHISTNYSIWCANYYMDGALILTGIVSKCWLVVVLFQFCVKRSSSNDGKILFLSISASDQVLKLIIPTFLMWEKYVFKI